MTMDTTPQHRAARAEADDGPPFGWVWRVSPNWDWQFTTDPAHIADLRQMELDRDKSWEITPLFKHSSGTHSAESAG